MDNTEFLHGKTVLITGGTGTFGRAFASKLISIPEIKKIIIFSRDEFKQSEMQREIKDPRVRFFLGDVRDLSRLERAFNGVSVVVHAAALKQVPAIEYNPLEAIKTNVIGTQNVIDAALNNRVEKVLLISSDKAVQPINLYGATKLCAEKLCVAANAYRGEGGATRFSIMRYGNVIGSRGSLVELISRQRQTGVITLTDERMTRFWIRVDSVMGVILETLGKMQGGEIFVPKMNALKVTDVIKTLAPECRIEIVGIRPGEKLHEILITEHEVRRTKDVGNMFAILPEFSNWQWDDVFKNAPPFLDDAVYVSNHPKFLLPAEDAAKVLQS